MFSFVFAVFEDAQGYGKRLYANRTHSVNE